MRRDMRAVPNRRNNCEPHTVHNHTCTVHTQTHIQVHTHVHKTYTHYIDTTYVCTYTHMHNIRAYTHTHTHIHQRLVQNYDLLRRRFHQQRDHQDNMQQKLRRLEMTKNKLDTELNSLKPEIKRLQAEKGNKLRYMLTYIHTYHTCTVCTYVCIYIAQQQKS